METSAGDQCWRPVLQGRRENKGGPRRMILSSAGDRTGGETENEARGGEATVDWQRGSTVDGKAWPGSRRMRRRIGVWTSRRANAKGNK